MWLLLMVVVDRLGIVVTNVCRDIIWRIVDVSTILLHILLLIIVCIRLGIGVRSVILGTTLWIWLVGVHIMILIVVIGVLITSIRGFVLIVVLVTGSIHLGFVIRLILIVWVLVGLMGLVCIAFKDTLLSEDFVKEIAPLQDSEILILEDYFSRFITSSLGIGEEFKEHFLLSRIKVHVYLVMHLQL